MLTLLGLPVPRDLEGRVPVEALEQGITATTGAATATVAADADREEVSDEDREILLRQMQKLGYMD